MIKDRDRGCDQVDPMFGNSCMVATCGQDERWRTRQGMHEGWKWMMKMHGKVEKITTLTHSVLTHEGT